MVWKRTHNWEALPVPGKWRMWRKRKQPWRARHTGGILWKFHVSFAYLLPQPINANRTHTCTYTYVRNNIYIYEIYMIYISTHILNLCTCTCVHIACKYIIFSTVQPPTGYAYPYVYVDTYIFQQYIEWAFDFKYLHKGSFFATPSEQIHWMGY